MLMHPAGQSICAIRFIKPMLQRGSRAMTQVTKQWIDQKGFDVTAIVEDAITNLMMAGMTNKGALSLLIVQSVIRMNDDEKLRSMIRFIEDTICNEDDDDA
jgi:hypothetical protein